MAAKARNLTIVTAESCTAGLLAKTLSDAPGAAEHLAGGAAEHLAGGFVTYSKAQKVKALGVAASLLRHKDAVNARGRSENVPWRAFRQRRAEPILQSAVS